MSRFKVGDRVRMTRTVGIDYATFPQGTEGYVVRNDSEGLWVEMPNSENGKLTSWWCLESNIELVAPADKKREFLERLQGLLRDFDAGIEFWYDYIDQTCGTIIKVGDTEINKNEVYGITPDNIMDFDKE